MMVPPYLVYGTLLAALGLAFGLTPLARAAALRCRVVDLPDPRKIHAQPTPLLGGIPLFIAIGGSLMAFSALTGPVPAWLGMLVLGGVLFLTIGLVDDVQNVGAAKLLLEFIVAGFVVQTTGLTLHLPWPIAAKALTVVWIVGVANAFNCFDCADGVATGIGLVAGGSFLAIGILTRQEYVILLAIAIVGGALGFLPYNVHPAKIFLGDAGSLTLGYLIAVLGVMVSPGVLSIPGLASKGVILAIPIYDIIRVHLMRFRGGERSLRDLLTSTGKDHLPHRLLSRGVPPSSVAVVITIASLATGACGVALAMVNSVIAAAAIGLVAVAALALVEREWGSVRLGDKTASLGGQIRSTGGILTPFLGHDEIK
ncbi:MAG TPA: MraY family glycosyltransferase [bacterium]|nr:MraY family glycosyltransferase [bacterium]